MATIQSNWKIDGSQEAKRIVNPIRDIVDGRKLEENPEKELINLSLGTVYIISVDI